MFGNFLESSVILAPKGKMKEHSYLCCGWVHFWMVGLMLETILMTLHEINFRFLMTVVAMVDTLTSVSENFHFVRESMRENLKWF